MRMETSSLSPSSSSPSPAVSDVTLGTARPSSLPCVPIYAGTSTSSPPVLLASYRLLIPPTAPSVKRTTVLRLNKTAFSITTNLDYTGGGSVTHFLVSFRENGASEWSSDSRSVPATLVPDSDNLWWTGVIRSDDFAVFSEFEFRVQVANERDMTTSAFMQTEEQSGFSN